MGRETEVPGTGQWMPWIITKPWAPVLLLREENIFCFRSFWVTLGHPAQRKTYSAASTRGGLCLWASVMGSTCCHSAFFCLVSFLPRRQRSQPLCLPLLAFLTPQGLSRFGFRAAPIIGYPEDEVFVGSGGHLGRVLYCCVSSDRIAKGWQQKSESFIHLALKVTRLWRGWLTSLGVWTPGVSL